MEAISIGDLKHKFTMCHKLPLKVTGDGETFAVILSLEDYNHLVSQAKSANRPVCPVDDEWPPSSAETIHP